MAAEAARVLAGRVALVTGAESGIGAACALRLAQDGADVALSYFSDSAAAQRVADAARACGVKAQPVECDVRDEAKVDAAWDKVVAGLGVPDILVNAAGLNQSGVLVADMRVSQWRSLLATDLTGAFLTCRRFIRTLRASGAPGAIVNITSIHAELARAGAADYDAAKGGLLNLTRTLALECAPLSITVNAIAPGMILTPMNERAVEDEAYRAKLQANIPLRRAGRADEVAALAAYLASPDAAYITGASLTIDGGLSLVLGQGA